MRWPWGRRSSDPRGGPFGAFGCASPAGVTDGLSNTVAVSEKLRGRPAGATFSPRTDMMVGSRLGLPYTPDESLAFWAHQVGTPLGFYPSAGLAWLVGASSQTLYNHVVTPNSVYVDCVGFANPVVGIFGARSNHAGGVNASFADGSVRFVTGGIEGRVWRALGTRAGGEPSTY